MFKKKIAVTLSAAMLTATLVGCSNTKKEAKTIKVGVLNVADSGVLHVAKENGFFEKNGVKVELVPFASAPEQSKAMEGGAIDAMMTDPIVQSLINKGDRKVTEVAIALGEVPEQGKFVVVSSPNTTHKTVKSLEGAKIAISEGTMMDFLLDSYCEVLGIDVNKIEKVNVPSLSLRMEMLLQNKIDDAVLPDPLGDLALSKGAGLVIDDTKLKENLSQSIIVVDSKLVKENKDEVQAFVHGYVEAAKDINKDPAKYRDYLLKIAKVPQNLWAKYELPQYNVKEVTDKSLFFRMQNWLYNKGLIKEKNTYESMVDGSFIKNANK